MYTDTPTTTATNWRHVVPGALAFVYDSTAVTITAMDPKSFTKGLNAWPARRGAPPH